jgi:hypothetical protein
MLTYSVDRARRLVTLTASGVLTTEEVLASQRQVRADPHFDPSFSLLADYRSATISDIDAVQMQEIAANVPLGSRSRRAYVVSGDLNFGMLRMFEAFAEMAQRGGAARAFRDMDEALRWLHESDR